MVDKVTHYSHTTHQPLPRRRRWEQPPFPFITRLAFLTPYEATTASDAVAARLLQPASPNASLVAVLAAPSPLVTVARPFIACDDLARSRRPVRCDTRQPAWRAWLGRRNERSQRRRVRLRICGREDDWVRRRRAERVVVARSDACERGLGISAGGEAVLSCARRSFDALQLAAKEAQCVARSLERRRGSFATGCQAVAVASVWWRREACADSTGGE